MIGAYGMSKAADHHLVRNLAAEWGPKNVRVNAIAPGPDQDRVRPRPVGGRKARAPSAIANTPLRRLGEPRDIGGIAVFLASDAAAFITGQVHRRRRRRYHSVMDLNYSAEELAFRDEARAWLAAQPAAAS